MTTITEPARDALLAALRSIGHEAPTREHLLRLLTALESADPWDDDMELSDAVTAARAREQRRTD